MTRNCDMQLATRALLSTLEKIVLIMSMAQVVLMIYMAHRDYQ